MIVHLVVNKYSHWIKVFGIFTIYGHDGHLGHVTWIFCIHIGPLPKGC